MRSANDCAADGVSLSTTSDTVVTTTFSQSFATTEARSETGAPVSRHRVRPGRPATRVAA